MNENGVKLIEVFNTWQGEGPDCGRSMLILRFKTCNLNCPWCDTKVKMRITPEAEYPLTQLQEILDENGSGILVTGGEPTSNRHFDDCVRLLNELYYPVANVESNGFKLFELISKTRKHSSVINYIYSPKIFSKTDSENAKNTAISLFGTYPDRVYIKIVYEPDNEHLFDFMEWLWTKQIPSKLTTGARFFIPGQRVFLMPEGVTRADLIRNSEKVFDAAEKYRFNFSSRDHIIYGFV